MSDKKRISELEDKIDNVIDQYNTVRAQNLAMNHALAGMLHILPGEIRAAVEKEFDLRCAIFQIVVNNGKSELDALTIQRKEFADTKARIFGRPTS